MFHQPRLSTANKNILSHCKLWCWHAVCMWATELIQQIFLKSTALVTAWCLHGNHKNAPPATRKSIATQFETLYSYSISGLGCGDEAKQMAMFPRKKDWERKKFPSDGSINKLPQPWNRCKRIWLYQHKSLGQWQKRQQDLKKNYRKKQTHKNVDRKKGKHNFFSHILCL